MHAVRDKNRKKIIFFFKLQTGQFLFYVQRVGLEPFPGLDSSLLLLFRRAKHSPHQKPFYKALLCICIYTLNLYFYSVFGTLANVNFFPKKFVCHQVGTLFTIKNNIFVVFGDCVKIISSDVSILIAPVISATAILAETRFFKDGGFFPFFQGISTGLPDINSCQSYVSSPVIIGYS